MLLSPTEMFRFAASALCRTDVLSQYRFMERTLNYREELIQFFEDNNTFASFEYFTRQDPETFMDPDEIIRTRTGGQFKTAGEYGEWARAHNGDFSPLWKVDIPGTNNRGYEPLDLSRVPEFVWEPVTVSGDVKKSLEKLGVLALAGIIVFYLSFVSFTRYDVR